MSKSSKQNSKSELSGKVLEMKFMRRYQDHITKTQEAKSELDKQHDSQWVLDSAKLGIGNTSSNPYPIEFDASYLSFTSEPVTGRKSFRRFNAEIEDMSMDLEKEQRLRNAEEYEKRETISDKEMANRFMKNMKTEKRERKISETVYENSEFSLKKNRTCSNSESSLKSNSGGNPSNVNVHQSFTEGNSEGYNNNNSFESKPATLQKKYSFMKPKV